MRRPRIDRTGCCEAHAQRDLLLGGRFAERWGGCCEAHAQRDFAAGRPVCREMGADVARPMHRHLLLGGRFAERWGGCCEAHAQRDFAARRPVCREMGADVARPMHREVCCSEAGLPRMRLVRRPWRDGSRCCEAHAEIFGPRRPVFPHGGEICGERRDRTRKKLLAVGEAYKAIF